MALNVPVDVPGQGRRQLPQTALGLRALDVDGMEEQHACQDGDREGDEERKDDEMRPQRVMPPQECAKHRPAPCPEAAT